MGGTPGNDIIIASICDATLYGDGGNDWLDGGDGVDMLLGGDGDDIITDLGYDDVIQGGEGNGRHPGRQRHQPGYRWFWPRLYQ